MFSKITVRIGRATAGAALIVASVVVTTWGSRIVRPRDSSQSASKPADAPKEPTYYDPPDAYDLPAIQRRPADYYGRSVPSRVWQTAPLPAGQSHYEELLIVGQRFRFVEANDRRPVPLSVRAKPGRPVTFTALDQGHFVNGRISITAPADLDGYAAVDFWVGDPGDFRVLAGSPENHGPAEFTLQALPPDELRELQNGEYAKKYWATFFKSPQARKLLPRAAAPTPIGAYKEPPAK